MSNDKIILIVAAIIVVGHILAGIIWLIVKISKGEKKTKNNK